MDNDTDVLAPPNTAPADCLLDGAPGQLPSFTWHELAALFAAAAFAVSTQVVFVVAWVSPGGVALLSIPFMVVCFAAFALSVALAHFADDTPNADLGPATGMTGRQLDALIDEVDRASGLLPGQSRREPRARASTDHDHFTRLVRNALDDLPDFLQAALSNVSVMVSDDGHTFHPSGQALYGWYEGGTVVNYPNPNSIFIFRDTLLEDYGHDPDALRKEVARTVRHELAHHLGETSERRIAELGL